MNRGGSIPFLLISQCGYLGARPGAAGPHHRPAPHPPGIFPPATLGTALGSEQEGWAGAPPGIHPLLPTCRLHQLQGAPHGPGPGSHYVSTGSPEPATVKRLARKGEWDGQRQNPVLPRGPRGSRGARGSGGPASLFLPLPPLRPSRPAPSPPPWHKEHTAEPYRVNPGPVASPLADVGAPGSSACPRPPGGVPRAPVGGLGSLASCSGSQTNQPLSAGEIVALLPIPIQPGVPRVPQALGTVTGGRKRARRASTSRTFQTSLPRSHPEPRGAGSRRPCSL